MIEVIALVVIASALATLVILNINYEERKILYAIEHRYSITDGQFARSMGNLLGPPFVPGNNITIYKNGDEIFPAMLEAIQNAKKSVTFETYIFEPGEVCKKFTNAFIERALSGVKVHVLLDWVGCGEVDTYIDAMRQAGVQIDQYRPIQWYTIGRLNNRTHRKLLVVDGKVGFTGGVGIADRWLGHAQDADHWRDLHLKVEGPVVAHIQTAFMDNWLKTRSRVLHGEEYFPELPPLGPSSAQMFKSTSREGSENVRLMYLLSIASATKRIRIANSYFVPDELCVRALIQAKKRGVDIEILVPGHLTDLEVVRKASQSKWGKLLKIGVKIFEYQPTMYHCKFMIVDNQWVTVGSTNFDNRSFRLNDEANLNILDPEVADHLERIFEEDKALSIPMTYRAWRKRPLKVKFWNLVASLIETQL
jgi:cardiolipin synthase A/B